MSRMSGSVSTRDIILSGSIGVQKEINLEELTVTENGEYNPGEEYDGFSKVTVEVPDPVLDDITITENGHYTPPEGVDGYDDITVNVPEPAPKLLHLYDEVTTNGNHVYIPSDYGDYEGFSQVNMVTNVPIRVHDKTFTANGVYPPEENYDGYATVTVNVPTAAVIESKTITANGTYTAPSGVDGYSPITVNVDGYTIKTLPGTPTPIASFTDGTANPLKSLTVSIEPVQAGSGDPSPTNVRPISGWTECEVTVADDTTTPTVEETYTTPFTDAQGNPVEVYGGSVDVVNGGEQPKIYEIVDLGDLTWEKTTSSISYVGFRANLETKKATQNAFMLCTGYLATTKTRVQIANNELGLFNNNTDTSMRLITIHDDRFAEYTPEQVKTALAGVKLVYELQDPTTFNTQPTSIKSLDGENNIYANTGDITELKYFAEL